MRTFLIPLLFLIAAPVPAAEPFLLQPNDTVLFLGDSNTFAGGYIAQIDAVLRSRRPKDKFTLVNLGLPSETCTGLTEKDHPFPRPDVHERLDRALATIKPTVVFICYGMNDGIYHPYSEDRLKAYQAGINKLVEKVRAAKARPILMTTPPFDALPVQDKTRPATADDFSYRFPFAEYDGVLRKYSDWLVTLRKPDLPVIDLHAAVTEYVLERRKTDPKFTLARDGIHPDAVGHTLLARTILRGLNFPADADVALAPEGGMVELPLPLVPATNGPTLLAPRLKVPVPAGTRYELRVDGQEVGTVSAAQLIAGLDLGSLPKFPPLAKGRDLLKTLETRHNALDRALLTSIGHKRPQTPMGPPLEKARETAAELETKLPGLAAPVRVKIEFRKVEPQPGPKPFAHRGLFRHAPENTVPAFEACVALRLGLELDVRRSRDGKLVILHDGTLDRTTNRQGPVSAIDADEIARLDAGAWFDPAFVGVGVPTLETVLQLLARQKEKASPVAVDVKVKDARIAGDLVEAIGRYDLLEHVLFIGETIESAELRRALKAASAKAAPARLVARPEDLLAALEDTTADWIYLRWLPSAEQVQSIHARKKRIFVAGALVAGEQSENWKRLAEVGVDAILTDYPLELRQKLRLK